MSIIEVKSNLLTVAPRVWQQGGRLYIRTSGLLQVLTLLSYTHAVIVDPGMSRVEVSVRHLWAWTRHRFIPFSRIDYLDYRFGSVTTSLSRFHGATDQVEKFSIDLVLDDEERVPLARFRGAGSVMTGLGGALWGDSLIDHAGTQEERSRALVELLVDTLAVPLGKPLPRDRVRVCSACGRHARPRVTRCASCGGAVVGA